jgi:hypothetical protein
MSVGQHNENGLSDYDDDIEMQHVCRLNKVTQWFYQ